MATDNLNLNELCRVCNATLPKYRCPRCSLRTCSLTCSKRHKLWSQCSGVRDPAAYLRRADLATPATIDRDFNYLVRLERQLDRADRLAEDRGIDLQHGPRLRDGAPGKKRQFQKGEVNVEQALERCRVVVERAPRGMQRQKSNKTHWNRRRKGLTWTVEWIHPDTKHSSSLLASAPPPRSQLSQVSENIPLDEAYHSLSTSHSDSTDPQAQTRPSKKRKLDAEDSPTSDTPQAPKSPPPTPEQEYKQTLNFYLHRPHSPTISNRQVLIPLLPASENLTTLLRDKVVLEYPTIYVLGQTPAELPARYMLEEEYMSTGPKAGAVNGTGGSEEEAGSGKGASREEVLLEKEEEEDGNLGEDKEPAVNGKLADVVLKDPSSGAEAKVGLEGVD